MPNWIERGQHVVLGHLMVKGEGFHYVAMCDNERPMERSAAQTHNVAADKMSKLDSTEDESAEFGKPNEDKPEVKSPPTFPLLPPTVPSPPLSPSSLLAPRSLAPPYLSPPLPSPPSPPISRPFHNPSQPVA